MATQGVERIISIILEETRPLTEQSSLTLDSLYLITFSILEKLANAWQKKKLHLSRDFGSYHHTNSLKPCATSTSSQHIQITFSVQI